MSTLLKTEHLKKYYGKKKIVKAVDDVSLEIHAGSSMALIGESGSGKTTFGKLIAGLEKSTDGKFWFQGQEMQNFSEKQFRPYRRNLQMIFQSSSGVFDPGYTIGENILEILKLHEKLQEGQYEERVKEALIQTGLDPDIRNRYVGQISGGQCQRANIARALVLRPELVICDEPVSSLDYSIRKQILHLLNELQEKPVTLKVKRNSEEKTVTFTPDVSVRYLLGFNRVGTDSMEVDSLIEGMPLEAAGVQAGDVITSINGTPIPDGTAYEAYIAENPLGNEPVDITYNRDGLEYDATVTPKEYRTPKPGFSYNMGYIKTNGFQVLKYAALDVKYMIRTTLLSLKELVTGGLGVQDLSGPVGVVDAIGTTYEQSKEEGALMLWMNMLNMAVLLSANLGVMNLLPLPALDGGRLVFLLIEAVRKKPVNREVEGMVHFAGLMLLMALMVFVMYNDFLKIF